MVLAGPDAMGAPTKDLSWLSANVVFANSRIQTIFKSTSLPSAVIWAKEILLLRTAFNFQNRLSRGVIKGNDGGESVSCDPNTTILYDLKLLSKTRQNGQPSSYWQNLPRPD
ncbi:hypothetical protein HCEG_07185 [Histoplasma capsulatum var. duboisii H88]|uniref:Uncharacterized protein n=1 Tax=Ajellomyces capsulatus (strain H88) TaxID=544711 RepID=F0UQI0_AJEC8|nr:hypothetical protein HCEG_07185 [Histoplasma capsulatum var. duboisii H88]